MTLLGWLLEPLTYDFMFRALSCCRWGEAFASGEDSICRGDDTSVAGGGDIKDRTPAR